jgi:hypothetical protein
MPDPLRPENLRDLIARVTETGADLGVALDGDGDRLGVVDDAGKILEADRYLILLARNVLQNLRPGGSIVFDVKCSMALSEQIEQLGGVPVTHIRYDNLKSAVTRVLFGRTRIESTKWITFRSHYGFDAFYCRPGKEGAHEKGGVEVEGGRFRRNHCVPMPVVESIEELNALLEAADDADDRRRIGNRVMSVGHDWAFERELLRPLPAEPFDTALTLTPRVDR